MPLTLFTTANNYNAYKIRIAAALAGVDLKCEEVKTVHDKQPFRKAPVLDTGSGLLFQSNAILRYLARLAPASLSYGNSVLDSAQVDQWIDFCLNEFEPARGVWLWPVLGIMDATARSYNNAKKDVSKALKTMNSHLQSNTYFVGHTPTIADAAIFAALLDMYSTVFSPNYIKGFVNLNRWFNTVAHHPAFAGVVGEVTFCEQEKKAKFKKPQQQQQKKKKNQNQNQNQNQNKKKGQQQQKKKEPKKPKPKHWSQLIEKSSMILDAEKKKFFSQKPFNPEFFNTFWDTYDAKGYCFYHMTYNYDDENKVFWMTQNQVDMYIQKLVHARKYTFGRMMLLAATESSDTETGPWNVEGYFLYRGLKVAPEMMAVPDSEYYTFNPVDVSTPEGKAQIQAAFQGDTISGKKVLHDIFFK